MSRTHRVASYSGVTSSCDGGAAGSVTACEPPRSPALDVPASCEIDNPAVSQRRRRGLAGARFPGTSDVACRMLQVVPASVTGGAFPTLKQHPFCCRGTAADLAACRVRVNAERCTSCGIRVRLFDQRADRCEVVVANDGGSFPMSVFRPIDPIDPIDPSTHRPEGRRELSASTAQTGRPEFG